MPRPASDDGGSGWIGADLAGSVRGATRCHRLAVDRHGSVWTGVDRRRWPARPGGHAADRSHTLGTGPSLQVAPNSSQQPPTAPSP